MGADNKSPKSIIVKLSSRSRKDAIIGAIQGHRGEQAKNRRILIEFITYLKKQTIFKNVSKLKGKKISILHDRCEEDREKQNVLLRHHKEARKRNKQTRIKGLKLEIESKLYTPEELEYTDSEKEGEEYHEDEEEEEEESLVIDESITDSKKTVVVNGNSEKTVQKRKVAENSVTPTNTRLTRKHKGLHNK
ncbi:unnamed protein product [Phaedon cochleariae]|uniref:Uncharacterized protein n=1 Tax=Phaedon cochleariae TaxID=80249 RepID=A0A9N9SKI8_PHACE|nr:unnamed protein product [Phaedon cochleariae]